MHPYQSEIQLDGWSPGAAIMMGVVALEVPLAVLAAAGQFAALGQGILLVVAAAAIGSILVVLRCRMPQWAKAGAALILACLMLVVSAANDPFGMRAVNRKVDLALAAPAAEPARATVTQAPPRIATIDVSLRARDGENDNGFATELSARLEKVQVDADRDGLSISGSTDYQRGEQRDTYGLTWSIARGAVSAWCGRTSVMSHERSAAVAEAQRIAVAAIDASRKRPACNADGSEAMQ